MAKLYSVQINHEIDIVFAGHVMANSTVEACGKAAHQYETNKSAENIAKLRATPGCDLAADIIAKLPPLSACEVTARVSKAKNPADWI